MPLQTDRRSLLNGLERLYDLIQINRKIDYKIKRPIRGTWFKIKENEWENDFTPHIVKELKIRNFFCRYKASQLTEFLPKMTVKLYEKNKLIFVEDSVSIVLDGMVFTKNHHDSQGGTPVLFTKHLAGSVIGCGEIDRRTTTHSDSWNITSIQTEVIEMSKVDFKAFWDL
jgi:hypothetical protein